jgi:hypothetical protein
VIHVVSTADGFNFSTIGGAGAAGEAGDAQPDSPPAEEGAPLALAVAAFEIDRGTVFYEDRTSSPPLRLTIEELETSGTDLALDGPIAISFEGLLHPTGAQAGGVAPSSRVAGEIELDDLATAKGTLRLRSPEFFPSLVGVAFEDDPRADRVADVELEIGLPANAERDGYPIALTASAGRLAGFDFEEADVALLLRGEDLGIERVVVGIADGEVELSGNLKLAGEGRPSPFDLEMGLRELDAGVLATLLAGAPAGALSGRITGDLELAGQSLEWESLKRTLAGKIALEMGEGALENVNLLDRVVGRMVQSPGLGALVASSIRDAAPNSLDGNRTEISRIGLGVDVENGTLTTDDFEMVAGDFVLSAIGKVGLDGKLAGDGKIQLSEEISRKLVKKTDVLTALMGGGDRIEVPVRIGGTTGAPNVRPDVKALGAETKRELTDKAAEEIADRIFGKRKKKKDGEEATDEPPSDRDAAEDALREGIGRLLGR